MSTFGQTRSQILQLEKQTEQWLTKYSGYEKVVSTKEDANEENNISENLLKTINKTEELIDKLNRINEFENLSASKLQQLTRHKEILFDHKQSYNKLRNSIQEIKNKNNLLFSIRSDLNRREQNNQQPNELNANDYILDESVRVNNFNDFANRLLNSAYQTRDELLSQRSYLNNALSRITNSIQTIPGINVLISQINTRRKRDTLILATVISVCIILLFIV